jgi:hypothetical protein
MKTKLLTETEFLSTFVEPMQNMTNNTEDIIDIWPYVSLIPYSDLKGHKIYNHFVEYIYRSADNHFDHVLVMTKTKNVYLTIVVDLYKKIIYGHWLLDLNKEYGLP